MQLCRSADGAQLAIDVKGSGVPLIRVPAWLSHLDAELRHAPTRQWLEELGKNAQLVRYDARGCGLSDRQASDLSFARWVEDLEAVVDFLHLERFGLLGVSQGGATAIAYALRHPERVSHLILAGAYGRGWRKRGSADEIASQEATTTLVEIWWDTENTLARHIFTGLIFPSANVEQARWFDELQREAASSTVAAALMREMGEIDLGGELARVRVPTLVLHADKDGFVPFAEGRRLAATIPGARFASLSGSSHLPAKNDGAWIAAAGEIARFLGTSGAEVAASAPRLGGNDTIDASEEPGPRSRPALETLLAGDMLEHWRIVQAIGAGGMGEVYLARDERLGRDVAIKVLPFGMLHDPGARERFRNEALALSKLNHPNIATLFDFSRDGELDFFVLEHVSGEPVANLVRRGPLDVATAVGIVTQMTEGLAAAHAQGVIHRDLKPDNLRLTPDGRLKILDFGLATLLPEPGAALSGAAVDGGVIGTVPYMSPEQLRGGLLDARVDIYATGVVLYELLTGEQPFRDPSLAVLSANIQYRPATPLRDKRPEVPAALATCVHRCLEKDPARRFANAGALQVALHRATKPRWRFWR